METTKDTNPKDMIGSDKLPMHLWPETASAVGAVALLNGMLKYGRTNWRPAGVRASIYHDALRRHVAAWFEGEENDPDDGVDHLGAALACLAILVDSRAAGTLTDDRMIKGGYRSYMDKLTPEVARLKELHKDRKPFKHYTIQDSLEAKAEQVDTTQWHPVTPGEVVNHPKGVRPVCIQRRDGENVVSARSPGQWLWGRIPHNPGSEIVAWKYADEK